MTLEAVTYQYPAFTSEYPVCVAKKLTCGLSVANQESFTPWSLNTILEPGFVLGGLGVWLGERKVTLPFSCDAASAVAGKTASVKKQIESARAMSFFARSMAVFISGCLAFGRGFVRGIIPPYARLQDGNLPTT